MLVLVLLLVRSNGGVCDCVGVEREFRDTVTPASRELFLTSSQGIVSTVWMVHPAHKYNILLNVITELGRMLNISYLEIFPNLKFISFLFWKVPLLLECRPCQDLTLDPHPGLAWPASPHLSDRTLYNLTIPSLPGYQGTTVTQSDTPHYIVRRGKKRTIPGMTI